MNMTQEQKEVEYRRKQMKLYLKVYKWWRKRHCKHWFREFAKYFEFSTPRMDQILLRDGPYCVWCAAPLDNTPGSIHQATTEHLVPRIKGGPSWVENELAACRRCNGERGHQSVSERYSATTMGRTEILTVSLSRSA